MDLAVCYDEIRRDERYFLYSKFQHSSELEGTAKAFIQTSLFLRITGWVLQITIRNRIDVMMRRYSTMPVRNSIKSFHA